MTAIAIATQFETVSIDKLVEMPGNPQTHNIAEIKNSIENLGLFQPFIVNQDYTIVAGHGRREALMALLDEGCELPERLVPIIRLNESDAQAKLMNLAANQIHGAFDELELAEFIKDLNLDTTIAGITKHRQKILSEAIDNRTIDDLMPEIEDFPEYDDSIDTQYQCPKCDYEWSGKPKQ